MKGFIAGLIFILLLPGMLVYFVLKMIQYLGEWWLEKIDIEEKRKEWNSRLNKTQH